MGPQTATLARVLRCAIEPLPGDQWTLEHSLLGNLGSVTDRDLDALPPGGARTIRDIVSHVGGAYRVYASHAWGGGRLNWDAPDVAGPTAGGVSALATWLKESFEAFEAGLLGLGDDHELEVERGLPWGDRAATGDIVRAMIEHTLYHSGELNHLRALLQGTDRWPWD